MFRDRFVNPKRWSFDHLKGWEFMNGLNTMPIKGTNSSIMYQCAETFLTIIAELFPPMGITEGDSLVAVENWRIDQNIAWCRTIFFPVNDGVARGFEVLQDLTDSAEDFHVW